MKFTKQNLDLKNTSLCATQVRKTENDFTLKFKFSSVFEHIISLLGFRGVTR